MIHTSTWQLKQKDSRLSSSKSSSKLPIAVSLFSKGRMKLKKDPNYVCHETIYQWIYSKKGNKQGIYKYLLRGKSKRNKLKGRKHRKSILSSKRQQ